MAAIGRKPTPVDGLVSVLPDLDPINRAAFTARMRWLATARPNQILDVSDSAPLTTLALAGRGWGKTRTVCEAAWWRCASSPGERGGIVSPTGDDLLKIVFLGESGLQACCPPEVLFGGSWDTAFHMTRKELRFWNGSILTGFTAEKPNRLRGPNLTFLLFDELASYEKVQEVWDISRFALRKGTRPITLISTTPKPLKLLFDLIKNPSVHVVSGSTYENLENLSEVFQETILSYEGTVIGRQEIHAELMRDTAGSIFDKSWLRIWPNSAPKPQLQYLLASYDGAYTEKTTGSDSAWVVFGVFYVEATSRYHCIILDAGTANLKYPDFRAQVKVHWEETAYFGRRLDALLIENESSGQALLPDLHQDGIPAISYNPTTNKVARAHAVSNLLATSRMYLAEDEERPGRVPPWARKLVSQMVYFPSDDPAIKDDLVDCVTQGLHYLRDQGWLTMQTALPPDQMAAVIEHEAEKRRTREPVYG